MNLKIFKTIDTSCIGEYEHTHTIQGIFRNESEENAGGFSLFILGSSKNRPPLKIVSYNK